MKPNNSSGQDYTNFVHGLWSQSFEVKACPGSILVTKSPKPSEDGLVGGSISLHCEAEIAPINSPIRDHAAPSGLQYQW